MKINWRIFKKKKKRTELTYLKIEDEAAFIFFSDVELNENDIKTVINIILMNSISKISGKETVQEICSILKESNSEISSVKIWTRDRGRTWFVKISVPIIDAN